MHTCTNGRFLTGWQRGLSTSFGHLFFEHAEPHDALPHPHTRSRSDTSPYSPHLAHRAPATHLPPRPVSWSRRPVTPAPPHAQREQPRPRRTRGDEVAAINRHVAGTVRLPKAFNQRARNRRRRGAVLRPETQTPSWPGLSRSSPRLPSQPALQARRISGAACDPASRRGVEGRDKPGPDGKGGFLRGFGAAPRMSEPAAICWNRREARSAVAIPPQTRSVCPSVVAPRPTTMDRRAQRNASRFAGLAMTIPSRHDLI